MAKAPRGKAGLFAFGAVAASILCTLPLVSIIVLAFGGSSFSFSDLSVGAYLPETIYLMAGIAIIAGALGTALGWLVTRFDFPGRAVLEWVALLPLALPGYVVAFLAVDTLSFSGPLQSWLRAILGQTGSNSFALPDIRSVWGAALVLSLVLYPYVYIAARAAFLKQPQAQVEAARSLGKTFFQTFVSIELPVALPAIVVGILFALLEALNDIGAAQFFGVQTVTYGIYSLWLGDNNLAAAARLAVLLFVAILLIVVLERKASALDARYHSGARSRPPMRHRLRGVSGFLAMAGLGTPVLLGFALPFLGLLRSAVPRIAELANSDLWLALWHSVLLAVVTSLICVALGTALVYAQRMMHSSFTRFGLMVGTLGYAIPGTVLALGMMAAFGRFDLWLNGLAGTGVLLSGTIAGLIIAYVTRFLTMPFRTLETGVKRITPSLDAAGRSLGRSPWQNFLSVHLPLLRPSLAAAMIVVFVDAMKELPMTLLMRPFDFNTLATRVYDSASLSQFEDAALPAVIIVLAGLLPVALLSRQFKQATFRD